MMNKDNITEEYALLKLTSLCAKSEYCIEDMRKKMKRWNLDVDVQERIIKYLIAERYIDERRYAKLFIESKIKYNKWGKRKVEQALYAKRIPEQIYSTILNDVSNEDYKDILLPLLEKKVKTIKADSDYEKNGKLIRFAMQRGFSYEEAKDCIDIMYKR